MKKTLLRFGFGALAAGILYLALFFSNASTTQAIIRPSNTGVFAGRFIPAFIGGAYDPSVAFQELAGMPVYVFAYDFWIGPNQPGEISWIVSDLAIRTQIRADGSFQVQGLPVASHYGVYFPFLLDGADVSRVDCTSGALSAPDTYDPTDPTNPCKQERTWAFRMPEATDQIVDVFSYAAQYLEDPFPVVDSQIGTPGDYEQVAIQHAFLTNKTEVDIENNINTFPVVPNRVLRVELQTPATEAAGTEFEIWAMRITEQYTTGLSPVLNYPIIKGRAIRVREEAASNYHIFQAYAPEGYYAVTIWRRELGSPTYKTWDGEAPLNSHRTGWAQIWVNEDSDWRNALSFTDYIYPYQNRLIIWGVVTNEQGQILSSLTPTMPDAYVRIVSDLLGLPYYAMGAGYNDSRIVLACCMIIDPGSSIFAPRGIYALGVNSIVNLIPRSDNITVYLDNTQGGLGNYARSATSAGFVHSLSGPKRVDLVVKSSTAGLAGGYDDGLLIRATHAGLFASGAMVTIGVVGSPADIPAENKVYYLDRLGELHVSHSDFRDYSGDVVVKITLPGVSSFQVVSYDPSSLNTASATLVRAAPSKTNKFNLAILNKISDFAKKIMGKEVYAADPVLVPVAIGIKKPQQEISGELNVNIYYDIPGEDPVQCNICEISEDRDGTILVTNGNVADLDSFWVRLPIPNSSFGTVAECEAQIGAGHEYCVNLAKARAAFQQMSYRIVAQAEVDGTPWQAEQKIQVDDMGNANPPNAVLLMSVDCDALGEEAAAVAAAAKKSNWFTELFKKVGIDFESQLTGALTKAGCSIGKFFTSNLPAVFGSIYKYGLQTRALTQDQPVLSLFDVVRNIVNVIFVIIFVIIGIMTIVRFQPEEWHISVLLPKLVMALVVANFSVLIVQALLDLNNFATNTIFQFTMGIIDSLLTASGSKPLVGATAATGGIAVMGGMGAALAGVVTGIIGFVVSIVASGGGTLVAAILVIISFIVVLFIQALLVLVIFLLRYFVIWMGTIVAPAVFALGVLPWFTGLKDKWWKMMLGVTFIQTAVAGVFSIGILLMTIVDENSLFGGMGTALVGGVALFMAGKLPMSMLGAVGMGGAAAAVAGVAGAAAGRVTGWAKGGKEAMGALREEDKEAARERRADWEADYQAKHGKPPGAGAKAMFRARQGIGRTAVGAATLGAAPLVKGALSKRGKVKSKEAGAAKTRMLSRLAKDHNTSVANVSRVDALKQSLGQIRNLPVEDASGNIMKLADVIQGGDPTKDAYIRDILPDDVTLADAMSNIGAIPNPKARMWLLNQANKLGWAPS